jgi:hypothetical protein
MSKFIPFRCSICQRLVQNQPDNQAWPINNGRCCTECDCTVVTPARLHLCGFSDEAAKQVGELNLSFFKRKQEDPDWFLKQVETNAIKEEQ